MGISICGLRRLDSNREKDYTQCGCIGVQNDATQVQPKIRNLPDRILHIYRVYSSSEV